MEIELSAEDLEIKNALKGKGILEDVNHHKIDLANGVILTACADGDQMPDIFKHVTQSCCVHRSDPRIHTIALNGGALLIPRNSPVTQLGEDRVIIEHIRAACKLKKIFTVALYAHAPCGMAGYYDLDLMHVLELLVQAKERIKTELVGTKAVCFVHIAKPDGRRNTYFLSAAKWRLIHPRRAINHESSAA
ncbi:MAG: hypothetical protein WC766_05705 [Patescibacteria group bacterium]|jgi:hypothetical protein